MKNTLNLRKLSFAVCMAVSVPLTLTACGTDVEATQQEHVEFNSIVDAAKNNENLSLLVEAVVVADLVDALSDQKSELTVFAPTNDAFQKLLDSLDITKEELFADKELLTNVLTYHVVADAVVKESDIPFGKAIQTLHGGAFSVDTNSVITDAKGNASNIVVTDVMTNNGVVHVIDTVLLPETDKSIVDIASTNAKFSLLVEALKAADLADTIAKTDNITVFAPTNTAFSNVLTELDLTKEQLFASKELLSKVLTYHVVADRVYSSELPKKTQTLAKQEIMFDGVRITDESSRVSEIIMTDIQATNGVVHVIDTVLLPK